MIVTFSVSNFLSFAEEETISLVASKRLDSAHPHHAIPIPGSGEKVLRSAVLYGANGAGKSNLVEALRFFRSIAIRQRSEGAGTGRTAFRFGNQDEPSTFDLQFISGDKLYRLGFKLDDRRVIEEWLVQIAGHEKTLYERVTAADGKVTVDARGLGKSSKLRKLSDVGCPPNQSFLASAAGLVVQSQFGPQVGPVLNFLRDGLMLIRPDAPFGPLAKFLADDSELRTFAGDFLRRSSTGVQRLEVSETPFTEAELRKLMPGQVADMFLESTGKSPSASILPLPDGAELFVGPNGDQKRRYSVQTIHAGYDGQPVKLSLREESDGTRRLLDLIPALHESSTGGGVYVIDEIDRSLHPILARGFLNYFLNNCRGHLRQLLVTTHESSLLDLDLLRRDEVWFAEKDERGATRLYSLADFKVRNDLEIRKHYLAGRFGAIPFLGNFDRLMEESAEVK
ncbi:MAG: AAA family ATPase [Bryobacteraceae bacterium]